MTMEETRETQNQKETARLLIIEDEIPIADLLQYGLSREGFQVVCAHTAGAAISLAGSFLPQVILLDWMLPDMDGLELCRILSAEYNAPLIMLTARSDMEDKLKGLESPLTCVRWLCGFGRCCAVLKKPGRTAAGRRGPRFLSPNRSIW